ncbi:multiple sugar transport system permease protein [Amycolatopsis lexingtonensis]|uniref:Multiple sugar transport system permease protein n=1 Tax=Amycolatopsis lexingtonensis TaxID=218822 RepID=A0ABR9IF06_9PSEU|nr:sugar ABC transporter permease [Amycolatopsis lexingtonensis]MBE1501767.1 multiple sugar transport system permease protein [Amycolatopsis lexingtonensis]
MGTLLATPVTPGAAPPRGTRGRRRPLRHDGRAGWLFLAPTLIVLGLFMVLPILMALWVSVSDWTGNGSPFSSRVNFVGGDNYAALLTEPGLTRQNFATSVRNNGYFVLFVVPLQTALALFLALLLHRKKLKGRQFFRTAFYFPTVTSSVAISVVFLFLFSSTGTVNAALKLFGVDGPSWFADPRGIFHLALGDPASPPSGLAGHGFLGLSWWDWLSGPSVAMCSIIVLVVWTSTGGFMLMFYAALQNLPPSVDEAALIDGATSWQRFWRVTLPQLRPTLFLVLTLGLIGTWQVFDQVYVLSRGNPANTTLTPAYLSYSSSFIGHQWGQGAAIAFLLFLVIVAFTLVQRWALRERR